MGKLMDNLTESSSLPFACLKFIQIPVKDIGLLVLSIISFQTEEGLELWCKCKAHGKKKSILCKYQLLLCPSDHGQLSTTANTFFFFFLVR